MSTTLILVVAIALVFDFTNGFHDTANAVATSVSTRALPPQLAVGIAAVLNFVGAFISLEIAATIAKGIVDQDQILGGDGLAIVMAGLVGAITWNLLTWFFGLPSSSSHALIGGVVGAMLAGAGTDAIQWTGIRDKVLVPSLLAPLFGIVLAAIIVSACTWLIIRTRPNVVNNVFRKLQILSGSFVALTHGTNDAQKTMGIIALALVADGELAKGADPPLWVVFGAASAIALGTYAGGWRIIKTLGQHVTKLTPLQGFGAQTSCAAILWVTQHYGYPVSTTHTISGSVLGAGMTRRLRAVRWGVAGNILVAWILTLPSATLVGAAMQYVTRLPGGTGIVFALAVAICGFFFAARRVQTLPSRGDGGGSAPTAQPVGAGADGSS
jgi:inorganic phosphate transporter, PiT family